MRQRTVFFLLFVLGGCYRDNEEDLAPCRIEPGSISYADVQTLLTQHGCYGCHSGVAPSAGVSLATHAQLKTWVDNGRLMGSITHAPGYAAMPQGAPKMPDCDLRRIRAWIDAGAPGQ